MESELEIQVFCKNIADLRKQYHFTQKEMAGILHIGVGSLAKLESGMLPVGMGVDVLFRVYDVFHILPQNLFLPWKPDASPSSLL